MLAPWASRGCAMPARELAGCLGEESGFCALERHPPSEPQNPALVSSGSVGRSWKLVTRKAAMRSGWEPL